MSRVKKGLIFIFILVNIYGLLCGAIYFFQDSLIFLPTELNQDHEYVMDWPYEEISLKTEDGATLNGLHFKLEDPKGVILYYHGNAGNLQRWGEITGFFVEKGYDIVVMDYRGYGKSTGERTMNSLYSDSVLWYDYVKEHYLEDEVIVYGRSLGTTFATYAASKNRPAKLILETPFYSLTDIAKNRFSILPVNSLLHYKFPTFQFIDQVVCPIVIYHGTDDDVIDIVYGKRLYDAIEQQDKMFITVDDGGHNNLVAYNGYLNSIDEVLEIRRDED